MNLGTTLPTGELVQPVVPETPNKACAREPLMQKKELVGGPALSKLTRGSISIDHIKGLTGFGHEHGC